MTPNVCDALHFLVKVRGRPTKDSKPDYYDALAVHGDEEVGFVLASAAFGLPGIRGVHGAHVDEKYRRCGVGTKLYTILAKRLCADGLKLQSDTIRSWFAQGFWAKQHAKGRATCRRNAPGRVATPYRPSTELEVPRGLPARWPCYTYTLKCPVVDLAGSRGRRR